MNIREMQIEKYMHSLSSDMPIPGGGSAGALCGAQGAALALMVINLTTSRERYESCFALCRDAEQKMTVLKDKFLSATDKDTEAYSMVCAAHKMPGSTDAERIERKNAVSKAAIAASEAPIDVMRITLEALSTVKKLVGNSNPNVASDLGVAAVNLLCCAQSQWLNVLANLGSINDAEVRDKLKKESEELLQKAETAAARIFVKIEETLK